MRSGVILYGGKSARMGKDKGMLKFRGRPLFHWVLESINQVVDEIVVSISHEFQQEDLHFQQIKPIIVRDEVPRVGPIGGLLTGLKWARGEYVGVAPVDAPLIRPQLYELLFQRAREHDGAVPKIGPYFEPLVAVYKRDAMVSAIEAALARHEHWVRAAFKGLDIIEVRKEALEAVDPQLLSFTNINTVEDLKKIETHFKLKE